jgi:hypothetical protein
MNELLKIKPKMISSQVLKYFTYVFDSLSSNKWIMVKSHLMLANTVNTYLTFF